MIEACGQLRLSEAAMETLAARAELTEEERKVLSVGTWTEEAVVSWVAEDLSAIENAR